MINYGDTKLNTEKKLALRLVFIPLVMALLSIIMYVSFTAIGVAGFSQEKGYTVYSLDEKTEEWKYEYKYEYKDGEDTKIETFKDKDIHKEYIRVLSPTAKVIIKVFVQALTVAVLCFMVYNYMAPKGEEDRNKADLNHIDGNNRLGLNAGLLASIPYAVVYILLIVGKYTGTSLFYSIYKIANFTYFYLFELFTNNAITVKSVPVWSFPLLIILLAILPALSGLSYYLGYNHISIGKNLVYGKNKKEGK